MQKQTFYIVGMTCAGCARSLRNALTTAGFTVSESDISVRDARLKLDAGADPDRVRAAVESAGFAMQEPDE